VRAIYSSIPLLRSVTRQTERFAIRDPDVVMVSIERFLVWQWLRLLSCCARARMGIFLLIRHKIARALESVVNYACVRSSCVFGNEYAGTDLAAMEKRRPGAAFESFRQFYCSLK